MKEYKIVYNYRGHILEAGQNGFIPSYEIAEKIMQKYKARSLYEGRELYLQERELEGLPDKVPCRILEGKMVYNRDWLYFDALVPGDLIEEEVINELMDVVPPVSMSAGYLQVGEPYATKILDGVERNVYSTYRKVAEETWKYCGVCFCGEKTERGTFPNYYL